MDNYWALKNWPGTYYSRPNNYDNNNQDNFYSHDKVMIL